MTIAATNASYDGEALIVDGTTATVNGTHAFDSVEVVGGGVVNHSAATTTATYQINWTLTNGLWIDGTSAINVSGDGYMDGYTLGDTKTGAATGWSAGTYGGYGYVYSGSTDADYGDYRNPDELGSGGSNASISSASPGGPGAGGGLVQITATTADIDGGIRANGNTGWNYYGVGGGGSGGGVYLNVGTLSGAGTIQANGGGGGEGGGGGRVAIDYNDMSNFTAANVTANAGNAGGSSGGAGTVYLKNNNSTGALWIDGYGTPNDAWTPLGVAGDSAFDVDELVISGAGVVAAPQHQMPIVANNVQVLQGAVLTTLPTTASQEYSLLLTIADALTVDATSAIDVSGRGYMDGYTLGDTKTGAATGWSAGTYGGYGYVYSGSTDADYGDYRNPDELGSGGSNASISSASPGGPGAGGGLVQITATTADIDGAIRANGNTGWNYYGVGGGGSGGGVYLNVGTLSGAGTIQANGGGGGEGGGGGRVAIDYNDMSNFTAANVTANAGNAGGSSGGAGTVYLKNNNSTGALWIDGYGTPNDAWTPLGVAGDSAFDVDELVISGAGVVAAPQHQMPIVANNVQVLQGAVLTTLPTTASQEYSLLLTIADALTVDATSAIDVSGRGYMDGYTLGDTKTGAATGWSAGTYGGYGYVYSGSTNADYGDYRSPSNLGSGGSNANRSDSSPDGPGAGGGLVQITAATADIDGAIRADGNTGWNYYGWGGGGSGGGIYLNVGTLSGAGSIQANGGNTGGGPAGGGGGGRVAIDYNDMSQFTAANVTAIGGSGGNGSGGVGTVYLKNNNGEGVLWIDSYGASTGMWTPLGISSDTEFNVDDLVITGAGVVAAPVQQMPIVANNVDVLQKAVLTTQPTTATQQYSLLLTVTQTLTVDATSAIDVSGRGYMDGYTLGDTKTGAATGWSAGTYGGYGYVYSGSTNADYGDYRSPSNLGSGGSNAGISSASPDGPGAGGGLVQITATTADIDGAIRADGNTGWNYYGWGGGGSGGGIFLNVGTLSGAGSIQANGGNTGGGPAGGGGGGRVAIDYNDMSGFTAANVTASAGNGGNGAGGVGTVYLKNNNGEGVLRIDSHGTPAGMWTPLGISTDTEFDVDHLVISGAGVVAAPVQQMPIVANNVDVLDGAVLTTQATTASQQYSLVLTVAGELTVDATSAIDVSGKGYMEGYTLGDTTAGAATSWGAGSYGGPGEGDSNAIYGDADDPNNLGSGGNNANISSASPDGPGAGGGLVQITATTANVNGAIRANGNSGWNYYGWGGGGSGGGILMNVGTLSGAGSIQANGGSTGGGPGGGGGGGRVAVYTWTANGDTLPAANVTANGGTGGAGAGGPGTVVFSQTPSYMWLTTDTLFHGTETLAWQALATDPTKIFADLTAYQGQQPYPIAVDQPCTGTFPWDTTKLADGAYQINVVFHDAGGNVVGQITRQIGINNTAEWDGGTISTNTVWTNDRVHIVYSTVTIESGAKLTIEPGTIVKFLTGENLQTVIQSGGTLTAEATQASPIVLTSLADDTAGGDTNYDGNQTTPEVDDWHGLLLQSGGTEDLTSYVQERYMLLDVACVPWEGLALSHETINGASTLLAGEAKNDQFPRDLHLELRRRFGVAVRARHFPGGRLQHRHHPRLSQFGARHALRGHLDRDRPLG